MQILFLLFLYFQYISCDSVAKSENPVLKFQQLCNGLDNNVFDDILPVPNRQNCGCQNTTSCFTKCCPPGYFLIKNAGYSACHKIENETFSIQTFQEDKLAGKINFPGHFYIGTPANCATFQLHPEKQSFQEFFYMQVDGKMYIPSENLYISSDRYCIDSLNGSSSNIFAVVCFDENSDQIENLKEIFSIIGTIASMPFLLATFIIYCLLPEKNIHAKALMFYVLSLFFAYLLLTILKLSNIVFSDFICWIIGFSIQFFFILSFFWMNVICIEICFTFCNQKNSKSSARRRFLIYCIYTFGSTFLITFITFLINIFANPASKYHPMIGEGQCFFSGFYTELLYFYGPMGLILFANLSLFSITLYKLQKAIRASKIKSLSSFKVFLRLFLAMGINWTMELISWAFQMGLANVPIGIWIVTDLCNAFYGVFIFFLFVFKRKVWLMLKNRIWSKKNGINSEDTSVHSLNMFEFASN